MKAYEKQKGNAAKKLAVTGMLAAVVFTMTGCVKDKEINTENPGITPIVSMEATPTPMPTPIAMTPAPGVTAVPTPTPTVEPTPTPIIYLTKEQAYEKLAESIDMNTYTASLINESLSIDGQHYFEYVMYYNDIALEPAILVDQITGKLYCFDSNSSISTFTQFPTDKTEILDGNEHEISQESALELLKKVKAENLGLVNSLSHYSVEADSWTTVVGTDVCYCFNVYEGSAQEQLVGRYYVSTEGTAIYRFDDENGEFIKIN